MISRISVNGLGPYRVVVSTAAVHARARGLFLSLMFLPHPLLKLSIVGNLRSGEVACSASDLRGLNFESCVWRAVLSHSSHHPQEVFLAQFSLYVHQGDSKPDSVHCSLLIPRVGRPPVSIYVPSKYNKTYLPCVQRRPNVFNAVSMLCPRLQTGGTTAAHTGLCYNVV